MIKVYDEFDNIVVDDLHNAEMISAYISNFAVEHDKHLSHFNKCCLEVVSRLLWRFYKHGFPFNSEE